MPTSLCWWSDVSGIMKKNSSLSGYLGTQNRKLYGLTASGGCERFVSKGTHFCQNCVPFFRTPGTQNYLNVRIFNRQPALDLIRLPEAIELRKPSQNCPVRACGGDSWTRTNDPIDVNDVLWLCGRVCNKIMKLCSNRWSLWFQRNWRFSCFTGGCSAKGCSGGVHGFMNTGCSGCSGGCSRSGVFILCKFISEITYHHIIPAIGN